MAECIVLIIVGIIIIFISYAISEKVVGNENTGQLNSVIDQEQLDNLLQEREEAFRNKVDDVIRERENETIQYVEDKLAHVSNEKIMAVSEYSDQILEKIDKNHKEVVFLYDMLNEKENEMKEFVKEVDKSKVVLEELANKELEKQKMIQHKRIQKELEEHMKKQEKLERQKDDLVMSGYISNLDTVIPKREAFPEAKMVAEQNSTEKNMSALERMGVVVDEVPEMIKKDEKHEKKERQQEINIGEDNSNQVVLEMYNQGKTIMEIAKLLGKGQGEVKLVIDLFQGNRN